MDGKETENETESQYIGQVSTVIGCPILPWHLND